jgi:fatty-acyl-CoA synthase
VLKAFVVRRTGSALDEAALTAFLEGQISRIKLPKYVEFVGQIPRNASGKVLKTALRTRG